MARWEIDKFNDCLTDSGITDAGLRSSYRTCFQLALNNDRGMALPGALLPARHRPALAAVGAMVRWVDDLADSATAGPARFDDETGLLLEEMNAGTSQHPVREALVHAITHFPLPRQPVREFIEATRSDIGRCGFATEEELSAFARGVVGAPVRLSLPLLGCPADDPVLDEEALAFSEGLDRVDNLRDLSQDLARGWAGISDETLRASGTDREELLARRATPGVLQALRREAQQARELLAHGDKLAAGLPPYGAAAIEAMGSLYRSHLEAVTGDLPAALRRVPRIRKAELKRLALLALRQSPGRTEDAGVVPEARTADGGAESITASTAEPVAQDIRQWPTHHAAAAELARCVAGADDDPLARVQQHALLPPGKLLRPVLVLESAGSVGGSLEAVLPVAVAMEMTHVASLMHDDIIDGDQQRRGRDTTPRRFGQGFALLAANALYMSAMQRLTECLARGVSAELVNEAWHRASLTAEAMARGVAMELEIEDDPTCGRERYLEMARLKTAVLFGLSCRLGARLTGGGRHADALDGFGTALGMAFQIRDDLLPYDSSSQDVGKDPASDLRNRRPTLPVLLAHEQAGPEHRARLEAVWRDPDTEAAFPELRKLLRETGALVQARTTAHAYARQAQDLLHALPDTPHRARLRYLAQQSVRRSH